MSVMAREEIRDLKEPKYGWRGADPLRQKLIEIIDLGIAAANADPDYGTDRERTKVFYKAGTYSFNANACGAGRRIDARYAPHVNGRFEWHSRRQPTSDSKTSLIVRFIPARSATGEGSGA